MKKALVALASFSRVERLAYSVFIIFLLIVLIVRATISLWANPKDVDAQLQARLQSEYLAWQAKEATGTGVAYAANTESSELFAFDPNTLDSVGFIRLGIPPRAVKGLLNWRRHNKHFYKPEDLKPLYNLPEDVYARLAPYIRIEDSRGEETYSNSFRNSFPDIPAIIDLNTADSATLDRGLPGVGATLSHRIIERRTALGGFIKVEQIQEVYKFPDSTFQKMKEKLRINPASVKKMHLNTTMLAQMSAHPYVGEKVAKNILMYRDGIKRYESVEQLRQVPLMNEEIYRKIAPYFTVD